MKGSSNGIKLFKFFVLWDFFVDFEWRNVALFDDTINHGRNFLLNLEQTGFTLLHLGGLKLGEISSNSSLMIKFQATKTVDYLVFM